MQRLVKALFLFDFEVLKSDGLSLNSAGKFSSKKLLKLSKFESQSVTALEVVICLSPLFIESSIEALTKAKCLVKAICFE